MSFLLRFALLGILAWIALRFLQRLLAPTPTAPPGTVPQAGRDEVMRPCAWCKVHVPEGESTRSRGHYFCCEAHRDAFFRESPR